MRSKRWRTVLRATISIGLLVLLVRSGVDPSAVAGNLRAAVGRPAALGAAFVLYALLGSLVRGMRWRALVLALGYPIHLVRSTELFLIGTFFNQILPSGMGGDVVKTLMVAKDRGREGLGRARAASSVLVDRALGLLPLLAVGLVAALIAGDRVAPGVTATLVGIGLVGVVGLGLLIRADAWHDLAARLPGVGWLLERPPIQRFVASFSDYGPRALVEASAWGLVFTALLIGSNFFLGRAVGIPAEQAGLADWAIVTPIVALSLLLPSIGGWGTREAAYVALLSTLAVPVDADSATAVSLLFQGLNLLMALVGGILYLMRGGAADDPDEDAINAATGDPAGDEAHAVADTP